MARAPYELDHKQEMKSLERARRDEFNRLIGCIVTVAVAFAAVALIIGYWATHGG